MQVQKSTQLIGLSSNYYFIFCLSADYFGTGKGYKLEIWQEGVVSEYKERFFLNTKCSHLPSQKVTKPLVN